MGVFVFMGFESSYFLFLISYFLFLISYFLFLIGRIAAIAHPPSFIRHRRYAAIAVVGEVNNGL